jgi:hypothetical protein
MQIEQALIPGKFHILKPGKAQNNAFLRVNTNRTQIEGVKENLIKLLDRNYDTETEEFHRNSDIDLLKKTYYDPNHFINTVKAEIDQLSYRLFGLNGEDIRIVEN